MNFNDSVFSQFKDISNSIDKIFVMVNKSKTCIIQHVKSTEVENRKEVDLKKKKDAIARKQTKQANDYITEIKNCLIYIETLMSSDSFWKSQSKKLLKNKLLLTCRVERPIHFMVDNISIAPSSNELKCLNLDFMHTQELEYHIQGSSTPNYCTEQTSAERFTILVIPKIKEDGRENVDNEKPNFSFALPPSHADFDREGEATANLNPQSGMHTSGLTPANMTELTEMEGNFDMEEDKYDKKYSPLNNSRFKIPIIKELSIKVDEIEPPIIEEEISNCTKSVTKTKTTTLFKESKKRKVKSLRLDIEDNFAGDVTLEDDAQNINLPIYKQYKQSFSVNRATISTLISPTSRMNASVVSKQINFSVTSPPHKKDENNATIRIKKQVDERKHNKDKYTINNVFSPKSKQKKMLNFFDYHRKDLKLFKMNVSLISLF